MPFTITFRRATMLDAPDLLRWKNDPDTRMFSIVSHDEVTQERHATWMEWALGSPNVRIYIIEVDGRPCGDVRCEVHANYVEIAVKIDSDFRGHGIGAYAVNQIGKIAQDEFRRKLIAKIVYGNVASMRLFENCGYRVMSHGEDYYILSKDYGGV